MSAFDSLQNKAFDAVTDLFGDVAAWTPFGGGDPQSSDILFNDPNENKQVVRIPGYEPEAPYMEYREGFFSGLYQSVRNGNNEQTTIKTVVYNIREVKRVADGKTYRAYLVIAE